MVFQLLLIIKVNLVAKIMQSAYVCSIFHVKHKKLSFLVVLTWFLILGKIQDGEHCLWRRRPQQRHHPKAIYLILLRRSKAFHLRENRFKILPHIKNSGKGFHPPSLVPRWGYEFACTSELNWCTAHLWELKTQYRREELIMIFYIFSSCLK